MFCLINSLKLYYIKFIIKAEKSNLPCKHFLMNKIIDYSFVFKLLSVNFVWIIKCFRRKRRRNI